MVAAIFILYLIGWLICWPFVTRYLINDVCGDEGEVEIYDLGMGLVIGAIFALFWPIIGLYAVVKFLFRGLQPGSLLARVILGPDGPKRYRS